ncbi:MAG TPA: alkaline phosphatase D family protein [Polyangiaceae bacterium]|jgi:alkaline phosphatase D|nr:alkaline phosphatase D family protein [Polyangiaceae bacterium]
MTKLAVASCAKLQQVSPQPGWSRIRAESPDGLLLLGDTVYLDNDDHTEPAALAAELGALYAAQFADPHFAGLLEDLRARGAPVLAIYDDHDFLGNNCCGAEFSPALRDAAREELRRAFAVTRPGPELYTRQRIGVVDVILLDVRYHRRSPLTSRDDPNAVLGEAQWDWLVRELEETDAPYIVVASSTTFHAFAGESWEGFPAAFSRLRALLRGRRGALVVSGDVHRNALYDDSGVIEVVTSGVAGRGAVFGVVRENYGILTFDDAGLRISLRSLKVHGRFDLTVPLTTWALP